MVVDLDTHSPLPDDWRLPGVHDGRDVLALLAEWAGQPWPVTYTVKTPTGGLHLYYAAPDGQGIRNSAGKIGPLIDVRGGGGYVLAAGSVLDERAYPGNPECRELVAGGRGVRGGRRQRPRTAPRMACRPRGGRGARRTPFSPEGAHAQPQAPGCRGLSTPSELARKATATARLYWAARRAAEMIAAGEVDRGTAEEALVAAALEAGLRGGEREARRTFASAMRGGGL